MLFFLTYLNPFKKVESFEDIVIKEDGYYYTALVIYIVVLFVIAFGAGKLSYNYNLYIQTSSGMRFFYAAIAFIFSEFYYPFYAFFIDPLPNVGKRRF